MKTKNKVISLTLIITFLAFDISYAYPPEHNTQNSTLAVPSVLQQAPLSEAAARLQKSIFSQGAIVASICDIGDYIFGNADKGIGPLPPKHAIGTIKAALGKHLSDAGIKILNIVPVERLKKETDPKRLKLALDKIGFNGTLPDEDVVFVLYQKDGKRFLVQIAKYGEVSPENLPGYEWVVSDKYVVKYIPENYEVPRLRSGLHPELLSKDEEPAKGKANTLLTLSERAVINHHGQVVMNFLSVRESYNVRSGKWTPVSDENALIKSGPFDAMLVLGSSDERVPKEAAVIAKKLREQNPEMTIIASGKWGYHVGAVGGLAGYYVDKNGKRIPEAEHFKRIMESLGVNVDLVEDRSTNSGQNIQFSRNRLYSYCRKNNLKPPARILIIQTPELQLRAGRSLVWQYPEKNQTLDSMGVQSVTSYSSYIPDLSSMPDEQALSRIQIAISELQRYPDYSGKYMMPVEIPPSVIEAGKALQAIVAAPRELQEKEARGNLQKDLWPVISKLPVLRKLLEKPSSCAGNEFVHVELVVKGVRALIAGDYDYLLSKVKNGTTVASEKREEFVNVMSELRDQVLAVVGQDEEKKTILALMPMVHDIGKVGGLEDHWTRGAEMLDAEIFQKLAEDKERGLPEQIKKMLTLLVKHHFSMGEIYMAANLPNRTEADVKKAIEYIDSLLKDVDMEKQDFKFIMTLLMVNTLGDMAQGFLPAEVFINQFSEVPKYNDRAYFSSVRDALEAKLRVFYTPTTPGQGMPDEGNPLLTIYENIGRGFEKIEVYPNPEGMAKVKKGYEEIGDNIWAPGPTNILATFFDLPKGELSDTLQKLTDNIISVLPKGAVYHRVAPDTYHISVVPIQDLPFDDLKNELTPAERKAAEEAVSKVASDQKPYTVKFLGLRFGADGGVIAVFEDDKLRTQSLREALINECNKVCDNKISLARKKPLVSITLMRIFSKVEGKDLQNLKDKAEELKDLSALKLDMELKTINFCHETRWMHSGFDYSRKYGMGVVGPVKKERMSPSGDGSKEGQGMGEQRRDDRIKSPDEAWRYVDYNITLHEGDVLYESLYKEIVHELTARQDLCSSPTAMFGFVRRRVPESMKKLYQALEDLSILYWRRDDDQQVSEDEKLKALDKAAKKYFFSHPYEKQIVLLALYGLPDVVPYIRCLADKDEYKRRWAAAKLLLFVREEDSRIPPRLRRYLKDTAYRPEKYDTEPQPLTDEQVRIIIKCFTQRKNYIVRYAPSRIKSVYTGPEHKRVEYILEADFHRIEIIEPQKIEIITFRDRSEYVITVLEEVYAAALRNLRRKGSVSYQTLFALVASKIPADMVNLRNAFDELKYLSERAGTVRLRRNIYDSKFMSEQESKIFKIITATSEKYKLLKIETRLLRLALIGLEQDVDRSRFSSSGEASMLKPNLWCSRMVKALESDNVPELIQLANDDRYWTRIAAMARLAVLHDKGEDIFIHFNDKDPAHNEVKSVLAGYLTLGRERILSKIDETKAYIESILADSTLDLNEKAAKIEAGRAALVKDREHLSGYKDGEFASIARWDNRKMTKGADGLLKMEMTKARSQKVRPIVLWQMAADIAMFSRNVLDKNSPPEAVLSYLADAGTMSDIISKLRVKGKMSDEDWLKTAFNIAYSAHNNSEVLKVGAVLVSKDGLVIGVGINGAPLGQNSDTEVMGGDIRQDDIMMNDKNYTEKHEDGGIALDIRDNRPDLRRSTCAEQQAVLMAALNGEAVEGATLYATHSVCNQCAEMALNMGVSKIRYARGFHDQFTEQIAHFYPEGTIAQISLPDGIEAEILNSAIKTGADSIESLSNISLFTPRIQFRKKFSAANKDGNSEIDKASYYDERSTRVSWFWNSYREGVLDLLEGKTPEAPFQIEIHPYHYSQRFPCNNNCGWCTRRRDKLELRKAHDTGIKPNRLISFVKSLKGSGISKVIISGNSTEPLLYPWIGAVIKSIKSSGLSLGLFTNFYYGERVADILTRVAAEGDLLRISLDAGTEKSYRKTHHPVDKAAFSKIIGNIEKLLELRRVRKSPLKVDVTYLLTEDNSSEAELSYIIEWADRAGVDMIRFSVPLKPTHQNPNYNMAEDTADIIKKRITDVAEKHKNLRIKIFIRQDSVNQPEKNFSKCYHGQLIPVIGARGKLYPCTSTSTADFGYLSMGDLNSKDFDFWKIWRDRTKWQHDTKHCPDCTRFEYDLNETLDDISKITTDTTDREDTAQAIDEYFAKAKKGDEKARLSSSGTTEFFDIVESVELLRKNLEQFEADGAVGSLIALARDAKKENQKLLIGLETGWIPGLNIKNSFQSQAIVALMEGIDNIGKALESMGLDNVEIIRGNGSQLAGAIMQRAGDSHTDMHNIIIMASKDTIYSDSFTVFRDAKEGDKPFLTSIDPKELLKAYEKYGESLKKQLRIKLTTFLCMTLEVAQGKKPPELPWIKYNSVTRILELELPAAELIDYDALGKTYKAEAAVWHNA